MDLTEIGWGDMDWTDLAQDRDHSRDQKGLSSMKLVNINWTMFLTAQVSIE
jgi:hypothetical protein